MNDDDIVNEARKQFESMKNKLPEDELAFYISGILVAKNVVVNVSKKDFHLNIAQLKSYLMPLKATIQSQTDESRKGKTFVEDEWMIILSAVMSLIYNEVLSNTEGSDKSLIALQKTHQGFEAMEDAILNEAFKRAFKEDEK